MQGTFLHHFCPLFTFLMGLEGWQQVQMTTQTFKNVASPTYATLPCFPRWLHLLGLLAGTANWLAPDALISVSQLDHSFADTAPSLSCAGAPWAAQGASAALTPLVTKCDPGHPQKAPSIYLITRKGSLHPIATGCLPWIAIKYLSPGIYTSIKSVCLFFVIWGVRLRCT